MFFFVNCRPYWLNIYGIQLADLSFNNDMVPDAFAIIKTTMLSSHQMIRALNTEEQIVALSSASSNQIELVKWSEDPVLDQSQKKMVIKLQPEGLHDLVSNRIYCVFFFFFFLVPNLLGEWNYCHSVYGTLYPNIQNEINRVP